MNLRELVVYKVTLIRIFLYGLIFVTGFFSIVPLGITQTNFDGNCILYGEVKYVSKKYFKFQFGPDSVCKYNIYVQSILAFLVAIAAASMHTYLLAKTIKDERFTGGRSLSTQREPLSSNEHLPALQRHNSRLYYTWHNRIIYRRAQTGIEIPAVFSFGEFIFDLICSILTLVSAGTISSGFNKLCSGILSGRDSHGLQQLTSCASGQNLNFRAFDNSTFHVCISIAEVKVRARVRVRIKEVEREAVEGGHFTCSTETENEFYYWQEAYCCPSHWNGRKTAFEAIPFPCIMTVQAAVWISFFLWLGLAVSMTMTLRQIGIVPAWCQGFVVRFKRNTQN